MKIKYNFLFILIFLVFGQLVGVMVFRQYYFPYFDTYEYMWIADTIMKGESVRFYDKGYFFMIKELQWVLGATNYFVFKFTHIFFGLLVILGLLAFLRQKITNLGILLLLINTVLVWRLGLSLRENPYFFSFICFQGLCLKYPNQKSIFLLCAVFVPGIFFGHVLSGVFSFLFFLIWIFKFNFSHFSWHFKKYYFSPLLLCIILALPVLTETFMGIQRQATYGQEANATQSYGLIGLKNGLYIKIDSNKTNTLSSGELALISYLFLNSPKFLFFYSIAPTFFIFLLGYVPFLGVTQNRVIIYLVGVFAIFTTLYSKIGGKKMYILAYFFALIYGITGLSPLLFSSYNVITESNIAATKIFLAGLSPEDKIVCGRASCKAILFLDTSMHSRMLNLFEDLQMKNSFQVNDIVDGYVSFDNEESLVVSEEDFLRRQKDIIDGKMVGISKGIFFGDDKNFHKQQLLLIDPNRNKFTYVR